MNTPFSAGLGQRDFGTTARPATHRSRTTRVLLGGLIVASAVLSAAAQQSTSSASYAPASQLILDWNAFAQQIIVADNGYVNPLPATRALAMMHLAMHDAINAAAPRYAAYAIAARDRHADPAVAAAQAAHDVLVTIYGEA